MAGRCARSRSRPTARRAVSGSFDTSAIRWSLARNAAEQVLRFHDSAVNAVALLPDGRIVTGGEDGTHRHLAAGRSRSPTRVLEGHTAPIVGARGLAGRHDARVGVVGPHDPAVAARRRRAARARRPSAERQRRRVHAGRPVAGQRGLRPDAAHLAARRRRAEPSSRCRRRSMRSRSRATARSSPAAPTAACSSSSPNGELRGETRQRPRRRSSRSPCPPTARSSPPPASAARSRSSTAATRTLARTLVGPGLPVWSAAFLPDNRTLRHRRHRPHGPALGRHHRRAHRLGADGRRRRSARGLCRRPRRRGLSRLHRLPHAVAGRRQPRRPDAAGIFGRRIATLPGYNFSDRR